MYCTTSPVAYKILFTVEMYTSLELDSMFFVALTATMFVHPMTANPRSHLMVFISASSATLDRSLVVTKNASYPLPRLIEH